MTTVKNQSRTQSAKTTAKIPVKLLLEPKQPKHQTTQTLSITPKPIYKNISFVNDSASAIQSTTTTTRTTTTKEEDYEILPPRNEDELLVNQTPKQNSTNEKYINNKKIKLIYIGQKIENINSGPSTAVITVSVIFSAVLVAFIGFVMYRKYGHKNCWQLKRMKHSAHGDSQSDIRFLASNEVLDFRLATSDEEF